MIIKKITNKKQGVIIVYENTQDNITTTSTFTCQDQPRDSFTDCLNKLLPHVIKICEFKKDYFGTAENRTGKVNHVSFSYSKDAEKTMSAVISVQKTLANCHRPFFLNTPLLSEEGEDEKSVLPEGCVEILHEILEEAIKYMNGERVIIEQGNLFEGNDYDENQDGDGDDTPNKATVELAGAAK